MAERRPHPKASVRTDESHQASTPAASCPSPEPSVKSETDAPPKEPHYSPHASCGSSPARTSQTATESTHPSLKVSPPPSPTSLPNFLRVPIWEATLTSNKQSTATAATESTACSKVDDEAGAIKPESDIKVYVESTMNELLGWYGLSKMDNSDTSQLSLSHFPVSLSQRIPSRPESTASGTAKSPTGARPGYSNKRNDKKSCGQHENTKPSSDTNNNSSSCGADDEDDNDVDERDAVDEDVRGDFTPSFGADNEVGDLVSPEPDGGEVPDCERGVPIICSWCQQPGNKLFTLETPTGVKSFCSELCFTQCRRASFKRNKVCEWCKHVRHTLNFVDFQDGDVQLQFCSEKCLNQYKMNIFCTEARQHLPVIQDMACDQGNVCSTNEKGSNQKKDILITPELWLSAQTSNVIIKQEVNEEEHAKPEDYGHDSEGKRKTHLDGIEPGEVQDPLSRWATGMGMSASAPVGDHGSCCNEDKVGQKVKSPVMSRQRKDRPTSRPTTSKAGAKSVLDSCHQPDRYRIRKLLTGASLTDQTQTHSPSSSSMKERTESTNLSPHKSVSLQSVLSGPAFSQQQMGSLPMMPNWASSQLFTMTPSHLTPSLAAANISSSLGGLGYASNPLLYSSLFSPTSIALAAQKEIASSALTKSRSQLRRELLRDRSLEADKVNIREESTERSTRSTSSNYSSSDTPGPSSTPGATMNTGSEFSQAFGPSFYQQLPHHTSDRAQPFHLPPYVSDPAVAGMFPLAYSLNHAHRGGAAAAAQAPLGPHMPAPPGTGTQPPPQHSVPPITILVPYPVAVPIPIPVPIPLPIAPEKFFAFFREKSAEAKPTTQPPCTQQWTSDHLPGSSADCRTRPSSTSKTLDRDLVVSPQLPPKSVIPLGRHTIVSPEPRMKNPDLVQELLSGRTSADSIINIRREGPQQKTTSRSQCSSSGVKYAAMSTSHFTPERCKKARLDYRPFSVEDEAIDLSKLSSRSISPRVSESCPEKESSTLVKEESFSDSDVDCSSQSSSTLTAPRIHIISDQADNSMCSSSGSAVLPTASHQSNYSGRRSRILDAPSVPKKLRSPSPERRYIRTVPRDMVEAARRRGLRTRVRTK